MRSSRHFLRAVAKPPKGTVMALELIGPAAAGVIDLNGTGSYISWGVIQISWANAIVVLLMLIVFVLALVLPFPGHRGSDRSPR